jgi:hypothetical protein
MQKDSSVCLLPRSVSRHKNDVLVCYTSDEPRPFPLLPRRSRPFAEVKISAEQAAKARAHSFRASKRE